MRSGLQPKRKRHQRAYSQRVSRNKLTQAPTSWADFWDVNKIPGKRGLRKRAVYNLE